MRGLRGILPGLLLAASLAVASQWLAQWLGSSVLGLSKSPVSAITLAILAGLLIGNLVHLPTTLAPGLAFAVATVLRLGIALLGLRLSLFEAGAIGVKGLPVILCAISSALLAMAYLRRRFSLPTNLGILIGVGTSICGATAIVAAAPTIRAREEEVSYAVACIAVYGMVAMVCYPFIAHWLFDANSLRAGLFLGTAVHDTAQVVGAGMAYAQFYGDERTLEIATVTKMIRNLAMIVVLPVIAIMHRPAHAPGASPPSWFRLVPLFIFGFAAMSLLRTAGDVSAAAANAHGNAVFGLLSGDQWRAFVDAVKSVADMLLATAMAAVGLTTRFAGILRIGLRPLGAAMLCALVVGMASAIAIVSLY